MVSAPDTHEQILARLVAIGSVLEGVKEWFVVIGDDETAADSDPVSPPPTAARIVTMTPNVYVAVEGTDLDRMRARVINVIATDAQLKALTKDGAGGRYEGARSMIGDIGLAFSFRYVLKPTPPVLTLIQGGFS
ncbi:MULTISPECIES: hypothetical protein [unclassified Rhizobium]|uniref:hypothetical protein n=1 Tax=unclassified Rhizobium TaxID=2613769 RepID=UPI0007EA34F7|nr:MULTISPECIES: hypothetical protein [unclassified Rhizobium]ANK84455.1 hypothetical protein AMK02_CH00818 [Rhizobium sp. N731]ANL14703.1 hypothetical protein AMJ97_CH00818 [Rhizobium sp. N1314]